MRTTSTTTNLTMHTYSNETFNNNLKRQSGKKKKRKKEDNGERFDILGQLEAEDFTAENVEEDMNILSYEDWLEYVEETRNEEACQEELRKCRRSKGVSENKVATVEEWNAHVAEQRLEMENKVTKEKHEDDRKPSTSAATLVLKLK